MTAWAFGSEESGVTVPVVLTFSVDDEKSEDSLAGMFSGDLPVSFQVQKPSGVGRFDAEPLYENAEMCLAGVFTEVSLETCAVDAGEAIEGMDLLKDRLGM